LFVIAVLNHGVNRINKDKRAAEERNDVAKALSSISKLPQDGPESHRLVVIGQQPGSLSLLGID
jgi:hypothetical protein